MIDVFYYDTSVKKAEISEIPLLKGKKIWIDVTGITKSEQQLLEKEFELHPLVSEDLYAQHTRIKVEEFPEYLFCVFYGIEKKKNIHLLELDFVLGKNFLITNHNVSLASFEQLKKDEERLAALFTRGIDFVFHRLLDHEIDNFIPVLEDIDDIIEDLEEEITKNPRTELLTKILAIKRKIVLIKKASFHQREKISFLTKNEYSVISKKSIPYFRDIYDHAIHVSDMIDNYREAIGGSFDAYMSAVSHNMNEVMKTLSIIATIALPLTVVSGIYGTNFDNLPGQHISYGFWLMVGGMIGVVGVLLYNFKKKKWF